MTADTMTPINDFIEHVYFPNRKDDLHASTLVGYRNLHTHHLKKHFECLRLCDFRVEAKTRQAILRHADVSVTEKHYVKPVSKVSAAAMQKFQGVLRAKMRARAAQHRTTKRGK
jgi:hypothetical protein